MKKILQALSIYDNFIIAGHKEPDGDCLCSQMALASFLRRRGKKCILLSSGPFNRPEIEQWKPLFSTAIDEELTGETLSVVCDCSSPARTGEIGSILEKYPLMVIDHHSSAEKFGKYHFIDSKSPSTTLLIQKLIEGSGDRPTREEADYIFLGFCTDTGFFRHIGAGNPQIFSAVSRLVETGVSPNATHRAITGGRTHGSRRLLGRILDRSRLFYDGKLIISWEEIKDREELETDDRDSDSLYQMLQSIGGVSAVAVIREESHLHFTIGLRSNDDTDVGRIAQTFGGGGHQKAAGCSLEGEKEEIIDKIFKEFDSLNLSV